MEQMKESTKRLLFVLTLVSFCLLVIGSMVCQFIFFVIKPLSRNLSDSICLYLFTSLPSFMALMWWFLIFKNERGLKKENWELKRKLENLEEIRLGMIERYDLKKINKG